MFYFFFPPIAHGLNARTKHTGTAPPHSKTPNHFKLVSFLPFITDIYSFPVFVLVF